MFLAAVRLLFGYCSATVRLLFGYCSATVLIFSRYVIRDTYKRAYLVVSLGRPNLASGFAEASTKMVFRLINVTGSVRPIVK
jgi:hypothetical protein